MTTVTLRTTTQTGATNKGEALTHAELDANFLFDQSGSSSTTRTLQDKAREWISPEDKGAVGDGSTDDSTAFAALVTDSDAGSVIRLKPGKTYKLVGNWTISKALTVMAHGATLNFSTNAANQGVAITASNVHWYGGTITGPQNASQTSTQIGISADGVVATYLEGIKIRDVKISGFGYAGIKLLFCEEFEVLNNEVYDCYDAGIYALSSNKGKINGNYVHDIDADGVVGTACYGIAVTKNNGSEATNPVPHTVQVHDNTVYNCIVWEGLDTHGGNRISFCDNILVDCHTGIGVGPYNATAGSERGATNCVVSGNVIVNTGTVSANDAKYGIGVVGDSASTTRSTGCVVTGNTIDGYGDANAALDSNGALQLQYTDACSLVGNIIKNSGRHAISIFGSTDFTCSDNIVDTVSGTAAVAASGTITFGANPSEGDTITINGRVFTFRAAPSGNYEILLDATTLATTLASAVTQLNGNGSNDGRVYLATYTANATVLTIMFDTIGRAGNVFTLAASVATVSAATLAGGVAGSCGITLHNLSGGHVCTGIVRDNILSVGTYTGIQMTDFNTGTHFYDNRHTSTGPLYDLQPDGQALQSGAGDIIGWPAVRASYTVPTINAAASLSFYIPMPGIGASNTIYSTASANQVLGGLTMTTDNGNNHIIIQLFNPSASNITLGSSVFTVEAKQRNVSAIAVTA